MVSMNTHDIQIPILHISGLQQKEIYNIKYLLGHSILKFIGAFVVNDHTLKHDVQHEKCIRNLTISDIHKFRLLDTTRSEHSEDRSYNFLNILPMGSMSSRKYEMAIW